MKLTAIVGTFLVVSVVTFAGCDAGGGSAAAPAVVDEHARVEPLGWLGGWSHPLFASLTVTVDGDEHQPGGIVVREIIDGGALAQAGVRPGDVVVRIEDNWVPIKPNPTLDAMSLVEQYVSAGSDSIDITCWRDGDLVQATLDVDLPALEAGLPVEVERFRIGAESAITQLVTRQRDDGRFGGPQDGVAIDAIAGLALLAVRDEAHEKTLDGITSSVDERLGQGDDLESIDDLVFGLMFLAERLGALPDEILVRASSMTRVATFDVSGGMPEGGMIMSADDIPPELAAMIEGLSDNISTMVADGDGDMDPDSLDLPDGVTISFSAPDGMVMPGGDIGAMPGLPAGAMPAGDQAGLDALIDELAPDRRAHLDRLQTIADTLIARQSEDGSWGHTSADEYHRISVTAQTLLALGMTQRVGVPVDAEPITLGVGFLRGALDDGKVAARVARGADRRIEAGMASQVALALRVLGCPDTDPFAAALLAFSDDFGRYVVESPTQRAFSVLATALIRRGQGLPSWQSFYDEFRMSLVAGQLPDGTFAAMTDTEPGSAGSSFDGEVPATALGALLLALQSEEVPVLLGRAENPFAPAIDGHGERAADAPAAIEAGAIELPEGAGGFEVITDPAEIERLLNSGDVTIDDE